MLRAWQGGLKTGLYYLRSLHPSFIETDESVDRPGEIQSTSAAVDSV